MATLIILIALFWKKESSVERRCYLPDIYMIIKLGNGFTPQYLT